MRYQQHIRQLCGAFKVPYNLQRMKRLLIIILVLFSMCTGKKSINPFDGNFKGGQDGINASISLAATGDQLNGKIILNNGDPGNITGTIDGKNISGKVHDRETGKDYSFTGLLEGNELKFSMVFPELNNHSIHLTMQREGDAPNAAVQNKNTNAGKERNNALIGVWKNTEVLGAGSDMSFSTEYFMEFREDGSALSWTGRSAGSGTSFDSDQANAKTGEWYTDDKTLHLVDAVSRKEGSTLFSVDDSRLMLYNEGSAKKIFQRVR